MNPESDVIYSVDALFTTKIDSVINCAELCSLQCSSFSYTYNTKECRGYGDHLLGQVYQSSTSLWKRSCGRMHYTYDPAFGTCVRLYTIKKTWTMASDVCKNDGTHLLIADTITKTQASKNGVHSSTFLTAGRWWTGGYDYDESAANDFKWVNGVSIDTGSIWHPNEPSSHKERCVNLYPASASLNDLTCSIEEFFVCQEY
ncbi:hepatic lectin-like [Pecten maximus]|uniref:hepatic lectin-like n=1 Tax=Pecten maximus TaxID=6579 RepID=UPI0014589D0B|nr:hepatic lectin-like [Pecten maximus]